MKNFRSNRLETSLLSVIVSVLVWVLLLTGCDSTDDGEALANRLNDETRGALFNSGLTGTLEKGQSVILDDSMTLTHTRIACIGDEGAIVQEADCGADNTWHSASLRIPLKALEPTSISVGNPDGRRGESGLFVYFVCRHESGNCIDWTGKVEPAKRGSILCKTRESCAEAVEHLKKLVALARPVEERTVPVAEDGNDERMASMAAEVEGAEFNFGEVGSLERHSGLGVTADGTLSFISQSCVGRDGQVVDPARCGADLSWVETRATVHLRGLDPHSVSVLPANSSAGESGIQVTATCWPYTANCVRWTAPVTDQPSLSLNCRTEEGCRMLADSLAALIRETNRSIIDAAGGAEAYAASISELRDGARKVSEAAGIVRRGGKASLADGSMLHFVEAYCIPADASNLEAACADDTDQWTTQETMVALRDLDPRTIGYSGEEPEVFGHTVFIACAADAGDCMRQQSTGVFAEEKDLSQINLFCRDADACGEMVTRIVTLTTFGASGG